MGFSTFMFIYPGDTLGLANHFRGFPLFSAKLHQFQEERRIAFAPAQRRRRNLGRRDAHRGGDDPGDVQLLENLLRTMAIE